MRCNFVSDVFSLVLRELLGSLYFEALQRRFWAFVFYLGRVLFRPTFNPDGISLSSGGMFFLLLIVISIYYCPFACIYIYI